MIYIYMRRCCVRVKYCVWFYLCRTIPVQELVSEIKTCYYAPAIVQELFIFMRQKNKNNVYLLYEEIVRFKVYY